VGDLAIKSYGFSQKCKSSSISSNGKVTKREFDNHYLHRASRGANSGKRLFLPKARTTFFHFRRTDVNAG